MRSIKAIQATEFILDTLTDRGSKARKVPNQETTG